MFFLFQGNYRINKCRGLWLDRICDKLPCCCLQSDTSFTKILHRQRQSHRKQSYRCYCSRITQYLSKNKKKQIFYKNNGGYQQYYKHSSQIRHRISCQFYLLLYSPKCNITPPNLLLSSQLYRKNGNRKGKSPFISPLSSTNFD